MVTAAMTLPIKRKTGKQSKQAEQEYSESLIEFAEGLKQVQVQLDFHMSARGWCYYLEGEAGLLKGDFDWAQKQIQEARERGLLPPGFIADEDSRKIAMTSDYGESPEQYVEDQYAEWKKAEETFRDCWELYDYVSFWEDKDVYLQLFVEKVDLKTLLAKLCEKYRIPCANIKGHGSLEQKAGAAENFQRMERRGKRPVLLLCADFDPAGLCISENQREHFERLQEFTGWDPVNLVVDRFGLNYEFIEGNGLTWIDGLETSSGKDISDPSHSFWKKNVYDVQGYVEKYGRRKCEANAVVVKPAMGRQMFQEAIDKWIGEDAYELFEEKIDHGQQDARLLVEKYLEEDI